MRVIFPAAWINVETENSKCAVYVNLTTSMGFFYEPSITLKCRIGLVMSDPIPKATLKSKVLASYYKPKSNPVWHNIEYSCLNRNPIFFVELSVKPQSFANVTIQS